MNKLNINHVRSYCGHKLPPFLRFEGSSTICLTELPIQTNDQRTNDNILQEIPEADGFDPVNVPPELYDDAGWPVVVEPRELDSCS